MNNDDTFHEHLDGCERCYKEIFNLCPTGSTLLRAAVAEINSDPKLRGLEQWNRVLSKVDK